MIEAAKEAVGIARGEIPAARVTMQGFHYVPVDDVDVLGAIRKVQRYLRDAYISDSCRDHPVMGCMSCEAIEIERQLEKLTLDIDVDGKTAGDDKLPPGKVVKGARARAGLSQAELAERVEAHWITISKLERGEMELSPKWIGMLAPHLGGAKFVIDCRDAIFRELLIITH